MLTKSLVLAWRLEASKCSFHTKCFSEPLARRHCSVWEGCTNCPELLTVLPCCREAARPLRAGFVCKGI